MNVTVKSDKIEAAKPKPLLARKLDIAVMMTTKPKPIDMVLHGLPLGSVGVILGSGGVGKSMLVLHIAHAVATGRDDLGNCLLGNNPNSHKKTRTAGRVVYLAGEDAEDIIHHRVHAFVKHVQVSQRANVVASFAQNVAIVPLVGIAPSLLTTRGELIDDAVASIREAAHGARLLVIDPLRQFNAGDENDNGMMTTLIKAIAQIAHEERCAIIIVHHVSKAGAKGDPDASMSRGAVAITDNARWVLALGKLSKRRCEDLKLAREAWRYVGVGKVKANYAAIGKATILVRGAGGVLEPLAAPIIKAKAAETAVPKPEPTKRPVAERLALGDEHYTKAPGYGNEEEWTLA